MWSVLMVQVERGYTFQASLIKMKPNEKGITRNLLATRGVFRV